MRAIDFIQTLKQLITCGHPTDICVSVILEGHHCVQCAACGAWREVSGPNAEHWNRPALVLALDTAAQDFADHFLSVLPDERPEVIRHRELGTLGAPTAPASETRMAATEAGRAAEQVLEMMFAPSFVPAAGGESEREPSMIETVRCLALCVEQLAAYQRAHQNKNTPTGFHVPALAGAAVQLRLFLQVLESHEQRVAAARAG